MPKSMVGLLAAVATAMPVLVPYAHGLLILIIVLEAALAAALVAICTAPDPDHAPDQVAILGQKKIF